jgi:3-phenylpropionate/trans-cinnamate dioxygenase ferredoxin reductase subunit
MNRVVIVGASACGVTAAATLRDEGFGGEIVLIGEELLPPYERPPLSKELLRGEQTIERAYMRPFDWYTEQNVDARFGSRATGIDTTAKCVELDGQEEVPYDSLLIATGIRNRQLDVPGAQLPGVFGLRTAADAERIREAAGPASRAAVVGMGFIGAEVAASLSAMEVEGTVIEFFETALFRVLGADLGRVIEGIHREHGVAMRFGEGVEAFEGDGRVKAVVTSSGARIECDFAVVGVGTIPNAELAQAGGIACDNGVMVDATLRTSDPNVFAAGDVANHDHPLFGRMRVEHFDNAVKMGATAARNILGADEIFDDVHWFWSDQYDANLQMAGFAIDYDETVVRGDLNEADFSVFFLKGGAVQQVFGLNRPRDVRRAMPLIRSAALIDPGALADVTTDLRTLGA